MIIKFRGLVSLKGTSHTQQKSKCSFCYKRRKQPIYWISCCQMTALIKYEKHIGKGALGANGTLKADSGYRASPL